MLFISNSKSDRKSFLMSFIFENKYFDSDKDIFLLEITLGIVEEIVIQII